MKQEQVKNWIAERLHVAIRRRRENMEELWGKVVMSISLDNPAKLFIKLRRLSANVSICEKIILKELHC